MYKVTEYSKTFREKMNGPFLSLLPCKLQNPNILYTWNLGGLLRVFYLIVSLVLISSLKKVLNSIFKKKTWNNREEYKTFLKVTKEKFTGNRIVTWIYTESPREVFRIRRSEVGVLNPRSTEFIKNSNT